MLGVSVIGSIISSHWKIPLNVYTIVDDKFEFSNLKSFGVVEDGSQRNRCALLYHPIVGEVSGHYDVICFTQKSPPPPPPPPPPALPPTISFLSEGLVATIFRDKLQAVAPAKVSANWSILGDLVGLRCFGLLLGADAAATLSLVGVSSKSLQSTASQVKGKVGRPTKNATPAIAVGCPFPPRANVLLALRHDIDEWHRSNRKLRRIVKSDSSRISYCCGGVDKMCTFDLKYISPKVGGVNVGHWDNSAFVPHSCTEVSIEKSISISRIASALEDNSSLLTMSAKEITDNVSKQISVDTKMISRKLEAIANGRASISKFVEFVIQADILDAATPPMAEGSICQFTIWRDTPPRLKTIL
jgi:hypothetical protein